MPRGGTQLDLHAARPRDPHRLLTRGSGGNGRPSPHQRARTTHRPCPGAARDGEPEQYGGRAPNDQSVANDARNVARSGRAEGRARSVGASGGAVRGPPPPPRRQARLPAAGRTRRTGLPRGPNRPRTPGGNAPATKGGWVGREQGGHDVTPPSCPPTPPTGLQAAEAPAPTPRGRGDDPPSPRQDRSAREGGRSRARPHAPAACSRRNQGEQANPRQRARRRQASTNRSGMGATPSMARAMPVTPALSPSQGRQRDGPGQGDPPPHWPPQPHSRGARLTGDPPAPQPPAKERPRRADPPHGERTAPSQVGGKRDRAAPPPPP